MGKQKRWNCLKQCKYLIPRIGLLRKTKTLATHSKFSDKLKDVDVKEKCKECPKVKNVVQRITATARKQHSIYQISYKTR